MASVLRLAVPLPSAQPSAWRSFYGFWWRVHIHATRPSSVSLTATVVRHSTYAPATLQLRLHAPATAGRPVQNIHAAWLPDRHPHAAALTLPASVVSGAVQFPSLAAPGRHRLIVVHLEVDLCVHSPGSPVDVRRLNIPPTQPVTMPLSLSVRSGVEGSSAPRRVLWLESLLPTDRLPSGAPEEVPSDETTIEPADGEAGSGSGEDGEENAQEAGVTVPYNLSSLLHGHTLHTSENERNEGGERGLGNFSDVSLVVGAGENLGVFHLHRCVLAIASPVFRAMLTSNMRERASGRIEMPMFTSECVAIAVRHIYGEETGGFPSQQAFELYRFAHQYEIESLIKLARRRLLNSIENTTTVGILCFSILYEDSELRDQAHQFIAHHFSGMAAGSTTLDMICSLPVLAMYGLLESDSVKATELEILMVSLRWLARRPDNFFAEGVLRRIRWGLMTPEMFDVVLSARIVSLSPSISDHIQASIASAQDESERQAFAPRRRFFGRPTATVWLPLIRKPPEAFTPRPDTKRRRRPTHRVQSPPAHTDTHVETSFEHSNLKWTFRAQLVQCDMSKCNEARVSASLWLEEGEDGSLWRGSRASPNAAVLPLRVVARCLLWNGCGGQLRSRAFKVVFRSAGWACGWSVQDLLDGHERMGTFLAKAGAAQGKLDALLVAVEICECTPVR